MCSFSALVLGFTFLILSSSTETIIRGGRNQEKENDWTVDGRHFVFKILRSLHPCEGELIFVSSEDFGPGGCPCYLQTFGISYLTLDDFILLNVTGYAGLGRRPKCIAIQADRGIEKLQRIVEKVDGDFKIFSRFWKLSKPTVIFLWPELLSRQNSSEQRLKSAAVFEATQNFLVNSNIFEVFVSGNKDHGSLHKASVWEVYRIKSQMFYNRLKSPEIFLQQISQIEDGELTKKELDIFRYGELDFQNIADRRRDFRGMVLVASAKEEKDASGWLIFDTINGKSTLVGGTMSNWFWDFETMLNCRMEVIFGDGVYTLSNGSLGGSTLRQLATSQADMSLSITLVVVFRARHLTFLQPTSYTLIHGFFKQPSANSIRNVVTAPFNTFLWLCVLCTWILLISIVKLGALCFKWIQKDDHSGIQVGCWSGRDKEFGASVGLWAIAANCQKSWYSSPKSSSFKFIFMCGSLCGVLVYVAYSAAIVSTLAINSLPIKTFNDLIAYNFLFVVHNRSEPFKEILQYLITLYKLPQKIHAVGTEHEVSILLDPHRPKVFLSYQDLFYNTSLTLGYSEGFICDTVSKVRVSDFKYKSATFLRKGSELTESLNHKIITLIERGFNYRYVSHYERSMIFSCPSEGERPKVPEPLNFNDTFTAFLTVFIGLLISALTLVYELFS